MFLSPLVLLTILPNIQNTPLFAVIRFVVVILFYFCWVNVISCEIQLFASGYGKFLFFMFTRLLTLILYSF